MTTASRDLEVSLAQRWGTVAGMDEVGRGALAGPVAVGVAVIGIDAPPVPEGLTDSKALTARRREALVEPVRSWTLASSVGYASPQGAAHLPTLPAMASCPVVCSWMARTTGCPLPMIYSAWLMDRRIPSGVSSPFICRSRPMRRAQSSLPRRSLRRSHAITSCKRSTILDTDGRRTRGMARPRIPELSQSSACRISTAARGRCRRRPQSRARRGGVARLGARPGMMVA